MPSQAKRQRKKQGKAARAEAIRIAQQRERRRRSAIRTAVGIVVIIGFFALITNLTGGKKTSSTTTTTTIPKPTPPQAKPLAAGKTITGDTPCPKADGSAERATRFAKAPPVCIDPSKTYTATFDTSEGKIVTQLDAKGFPSTTNNFVVLARYHYFDGGSFYRTDTSLSIIQGGVEPQLRDRLSPGYKLKDEGTPPFKYKAGELVVTRGSGPDSGGADIFFTTIDDNPGLETPGTANYVPFGQVTTGLEVVKGILALNVDDLTGQIPGGGPKRVVTIKTITITES